VIEFRAATPDDAEAIAALLDELLPGLVDDRSRPEAQPFLASLTPSAVLERIESPDYRYVVAHWFGDLVGYAALRDGSHLYHLFVRPGWQRRGVARALWTCVLLQTTSDTITVNSALAAVPFYRQLGFEPRGNADLNGCPVYQPMRFLRR